MFRQTTNNYMPQLGPSKQGAFYQLKLGKNNGPFLSKDIMYSNKKSMTLLTNKEILKSHQTMVNTIKNLEKNQKEMTNFPSIGMHQDLQQSAAHKFMFAKASKTQQTWLGCVEKTENFNHTFDFCQKELKVCDKISNSLKIEQNELMADLSLMNKRISYGISSLHDYSMPGLKSFFKKVKQTSITGKQENYQIKRELQAMQMTTDILQKVLTQCGNKIQKLEQIFNDKQHQVQQIQTDLRFKEKEDSNQSFLSQINENKLMTEDQSGYQEDNSNTAGYSVNCYQAFPKMSSDQANSNNQNNNNYSDDSRSSNSSNK